MERWRCGKRLRLRAAAPPQAKNEKVQCFGRKKTAVAVALVRTGSGNVRRSRGSETHAAISIHTSERGHEQPSKTYTAGASKVRCTFLPS